MDIDLFINRAEPRIKPLSPILLALHQSNHRYLSSYSKIKHHHTILNQFQEKSFNINKNKIKTLIIYKNMGLNRQGQGATGRRGYHFYLASLA